MTVFELRELARIIGPAATAMGDADAETLVTSMWRFLRVKNSDLSKQAWRELVAEAREDRASGAQQSAAAHAENTDIPITPDGTSQQAQRGFPDGPLGATRAGPSATAARPSARPGETRIHRKQ